MARADRKTAHAVELHERIRRAPYKFDFLQALRRLECAHRAAPRLGESSLPREDPIRLAQEPSLRFAPSAIAALEPATEGKPDRLLVTFFGLFGPHGPLPLHLTDYACDRLRNAKDPTFARFADVFHHRMLCLLYRAWAAAQPTVSYDRPEQDRFAEHVASLFGLGNPQLRGRDAMPDLAKLHFAGRLACQTKHREGLCAILAGFFRIPVEIEQFVGHWMQLPEACRWRVGAEPSTGVLGESAVAGAAIWDRQHRFRIIFGPLSYRDFSRFLPGGESLRRLVAVVRNYVGDELSWDVNLILRKEEIPPLVLGQSGQLGWNTWCVSETLEQDPWDVCLNPERHGESGQ